MLAKDPNERIKAKDALESKFFTKFALVKKE